MFRIGDKVIPSFKVGDRVKFKKSSLESGMIDATEEDVFTVLYDGRGAVALAGYSGWWNIDHFEHVKEKEEIMEERAIPWEIGQEVFCVRFGRGVVNELFNEKYYPVFVTFDEELEASYTLEGKYGEEDKCRSLFFSEPKIIADKFPPKKAFVPTLKRGDVVFAVYKEDTSRIEKFIVYKETKKEIEYSELGEAYIKKSWNFYKIGEEIKFS